MAGRILVIDDVAINRILLEVKLTQISYQVILHASVDEVTPPIGRGLDAVVMTSSALGPHPDVALIRLRARLSNGAADHTPPPILVLTGTGTQDTPLAALMAGADDALPYPLNHGELFARLRALMRRRRAEAELAAPLMQGTSPDIPGLAEPMSTFDHTSERASERAGRIAVLAPTKTAADQMCAQLAPLFPQRPSALFGPSGAAALAQCTPPDIVVLCDTDDGYDGILDVIPDLRAGRICAGAAVFAIFPDKQSVQASRALDLGADDVLIGQVNPNEAALRMQRLLAGRARTQHMQRALRRGIAAALVDPLTGLQNRRAALDQLTRLGEQAQRQNSAVALMLADVDHFKRVNDTYGHSAGDAALIEIARRLRTALPDSPIMARIGGEEFLAAAVVPDTAHATQMAETLRHAISDMPIMVSSQLAPLPITISVGVQVQSGPFQPIPDLLQSADDALYAAKAAGRNLVRVGVLNAA